jgi:hypothetical protein
VDGYAEDRCGFSRRWTNEWGDGRGSFADCCWAMMSFFAYCGYTFLILRWVSILNATEQAQAPKIEACGATVGKPRGDGVPQWRHSETLCESRGWKFQSFSHGIPEDGKAFRCPRYREESGFTWGNGVKFGCSYNYTMRALISALSHPPIGFRYPRPFFSIRKMSSVQDFKQVSMVDVCVT